MYNIEKMKLSRKGRERRGIWGKSECPTFPDHLLLSVVGEQVPRVIDTITSRSYFSGRVTISIP